MEIPKLKLSNREFKLIFDGLENLPNKDAAGEIMLGLMTAAICKTDEEKEKMKRTNAEEKEKKEAEKEMLLEDIKILQAKLIQLKRWMTENNLIEQSIEILSDNKNAS